MYTPEEGGVVQDLTPKDCDEACKDIFIGDTRFIKYYCPVFDDSITLFIEINNWLHSKKINKTNLGRITSPVNKDTKEYFAFTTYMRRLHATVHDIKERLNDKLIQDAQAQNKQTLTLFVSDLVGNTNTLTTHFFR